MHKHHLKPKHLGGTDDPANLLKVTVEEHATIHFARWIAYKNEYDRIAWLTLSGQIGKEEATRLAQSEGGKKNKGNPPNSGSFSKGVIPHNKGKTYDEIYGDKAEEIKAKVRVNFTDDVRSKMSRGQYKILTPKRRQHLSKKAKQQWSDGRGSLPPNQQGTIWINNGKNHRRIKEENIDQYPLWERGRMNTWK